MLLSFEQCESSVFFGGHDSFGLRRLVALAGQMENTISHLGAVLFFTIECTVSAADGISHSILEAVAVSQYEHVRDDRDGHRRNQSVTHHSYVHPIIHSKGSFAKQKEARRFESCSS